MESSGGKITLDQESFRALASDVRVEVLKRLDIRRETVTDLSNLLSLSKPTLLEHLEKLQSAGLVKRIDEGRKWIYYELSDKGRKILHPERVAITLALASALVLASIGAFYLAFAAGGPLATSPRTDGLSGPQSMLQDAGGPIFGVIALLLAGVAAAIALALLRFGKQRRNRFFQQLGAA
jgi:DNA-binding transcriptional ArsR family regulator